MTFGPAQQRNDIRDLSTTDQDSQEDLALLGPTNGRGARRKVDLVPPKVHKFVGP
jgi:hypothetical protein